MKIPFKVICLDDQFRPNDIPTSKWVKKGNQYTVIKADRLLLQGGTIGFQLEELDLSDCTPYNYFSASRFGIPVNLEIREEEMILEVVDSDMSLA